MHPKHDRAYHRLFSEPALVEDLVREGRLIGGRLPPVFPLLLYNGDDHWHATTDLNALIALPPNTPLWSYQPGMR